MTYPNGDIYEGEWKDNKSHGQGTFFYLADNKNKGDKYVGEYKDDKKSGYGTYSYADGDKYVGEWKDGKSHGQGTYTWTTGATYVGEWKDDKRHGKGKMTYADGKIYEGEFRNGSKVAIEFDPKKYWEGALNCYRFTDSPIKDSQRPYVDLLTAQVELYKNSNASSAKNNIFMYSNMIVENLGCSKDLFK